MGVGSSRKSEYAIGVWRQEPASPIDREFDELARMVRERTERSGDEYVQSHRASMSEKYSEALERSTAGSVAQLRDKVILTIADYSARVDAMSEDITRDCSIRGFCPRHVIVDGVEREIELADKIHPCQLRTCMCQQLRQQLRKYKRWMLSGLWPGDTAKPESSPADTIVDSAGLLEMLYRLQQTVLWSIEAARAEDKILSVGKDVGAGKDVREGKDTGNSDADTHWTIRGKIIPIVVVVIVIAIVALLIFMVFLPILSDIPLLHALKN